MAYDNSALNQNQQGGMNVLGNDPKEKKPQDELVPGQQQPGQDNIVNISGGQQATIIADKGPIRPASTSATSSGQFKNVTRFLDANRKGSTGLVKGVTSKTAEQAAQVGEAINKQKQDYAQQIQQGQQKVQQVGREKEQYIKNLASGQAMNIDEAQKFKNLLARKDTVIDPNAIKSEADFGKIQGESIAARDIGTLDLSREAEKKKMFEEKMGKVVTDENVRKDFLREAFQSPEKRYTQGMSTLDNLILQSDDVGRQRLQKDVGVQTEATKKTFEQARREGLEKLAGLYGAETDLAKNLVSQISGSRGKIADDVYAAKQQALDNRVKQKQAIERSLQGTLGKIQEDLNLNKITQDEANRKIIMHDDRVKSALDFIDKGYVDTINSSYLKNLIDNSKDGKINERVYDPETKSYILKETDVINSLDNTLLASPNEARHIFDVAGKSPEFINVLNEIRASGGTRYGDLDAYKTESLNSISANLPAYAKIAGVKLDYKDINSLPDELVKKLSDPEWIKSADNKIAEQRKNVVNMYNEYTGSSERYLDPFMTKIDPNKYINLLTDDIKKNAEQSAQDRYNQNKIQIDKNKEKLKNFLLGGAIKTLTPSEQTYKTYLNSILNANTITGDRAPDAYIQDIASKMVQMPPNQVDANFLSRISQNYDPKSYVDRMYSSFDDYLKGHDLNLDVIGTDAEKEAFKNLSSLIGEQNIFDDTKRGITMDRSSSTLGNTDRFQDFMKHKQLYLSDKRTKTNIKPANLYKRNALKGLLK